MISMEILGSGSMAMYFQNFYVPEFCFVVTHIVWQMSHGKKAVMGFRILDLETERGWGQLCFELSNTVRIRI
jgi:hypothetical protein